MQKERRDTVQRKMEVSNTFTTMVVGMTILGRESLS
jgi:hypothetical protein